MSEFSREHRPDAINEDHWDLLARVEQDDNVTLEDREKLEKNTYYFLETEKNAYEARLGFEALHDL